MTEAEKLEALSHSANLDVELQAKVSVLGRGSRHDICASTSSNRKVSGLRRIGAVSFPGVCQAFTPDGRCVSLFKTLYTNACTHSCYYCPNGTKSSGCRRYSFTPEELAGIVLKLYRGNYIEGLFLSSGVGGDEERTMEEMIETVEILRGRYGYQGYVHLKVLPGASREVIRRAMELADRVSINIETVSTSHMGEISPTKDYLNDILKRQLYIREEMRRRPTPSGHTTQMIVGGAEERDLDIFRRAVYEYRKMGVRRVYYSAFTSLPGTPFEGRKSVPLQRERRHYQMDRLYRVYGFTERELIGVFDEEGNLPEDDPKKRLAELLLDGPVDPNTASLKELLAVPGIGPISANRIIRIRKKRKLESPLDLSELGVVVKRAMPYLVLRGWKQSSLRWWLS